MSSHEIIFIEDAPPKKKKKTTSSIDLTDDDFNIDEIPSPPEISPNFDLTGEDPVKECKICYDDINIYSIFHFKNCDHSGCHKCFEKFIISKIEEKSFPILCPFCKEEILDSDIFSILNSQMYSKFEDFRFNHFLEKNQDFKCCLTPECTNGVFWNEKDNESGIWRCNICKKKYCLKCSDVDHTGTCEQFKQWKIDNGEVESKMEEMIRNKTIRLCPGCKCATQKNNGCNGMTCTRCKTGWCWNCEKKNSECVCKQNPHALNVQQNNQMIQRQQNVQIARTLIENQQRILENRRQIEQNRLLAEQFRQRVEQQNQTTLKRKK
jgi:hypothetical protein